MESVLLPITKTLFLKFLALSLLRRALGCGLRKSNFVNDS